MIWFLESHALITRNICKIEKFGATHFSTQQSTSLSNATDLGCS